MTRSRTVALAALVVGTLLASAQTTPQDKKDPQSSFEPRSRPGEGQKFLAKFVGDWDVVKTFHPRTGKPARSRGVCKQSMIHEGRFLRSEFVFESAAGKTTGLGLIGFEASSGKFTSVWTDSRATRMSLRRSEQKFNGKEVDRKSTRLNSSHLG